MAAAQAAIDDESLEEAASRLLEQMMDDGLEEGSALLGNIFQLNLRDNEDDDDQDGASDLIGQEDIALTEALDQKSERAVAAAVASGQVRPDDVMHIAAGMDESSLASDDAVIHEAITQQIAIPQNIDPDDHVLTALESWAKACSSGIQCLEAQQLAMATLQPQEGKDADLSMLANAKRDSHNNVVFVKWQGLARNLGRQAHIDDDMGIKWAMNTIPLHPFAEPEWQMVHPAIGTVMRRIKEVSHGKIAKHGALVQQRPRVRDDIIRLSQIWSVALALHNNRDNSDVASQCCICKNIHRPDYIDDDVLAPQTMFECGLCLQSRHYSCSAKLDEAAALHGSIAKVARPIVRLPDIFSRRCCSLSCVFVS